MSGHGLLLRKVGLTDGRQVQNGTENPRPPHRLKIYFHVSSYVSLTSEEFVPRLLELGRPSEAEHILQERISSKPRATMQAIHSHKNGNGHGLLREGTTSRSS